MKRLAARNSLAYHRRPYAITVYQGSSNLFFYFMCHRSSAKTSNLKMASIDVDHPEKVLNLLTKIN